MPRDRSVGDAGRLRQVLVNLVGNAIKFTEQGEDLISVEVHRRTAGDELALHFSVRDTGIGIPADKQQRIFEPFSRPTARPRASTAAPAWAWRSPSSWSR